MLEGDRLICAFVERQAVGSRFQQWLLHLTIVPWFRLDATSDEIIEGLAGALRVVDPFEVVADGEAKFGPHKNRPVRLLEESLSLTGIEEKVRKYLHKKRAWLVDETTKAHKEFRPHVTVQRDEGLRRGAVFSCDRLYIVEQHGQYKEIVGEVCFG